MDFKIVSNEGAWHIDGFAVRPDFDNFGYFNHNPDNQTSFWGIYGTRSVRRGVSVNLYYIGIARKDATYNRGTANELRHTLGVRRWRPPCGDGRRLGLRLRSHMAIRELWIGKYPGLGHRHGKGYSMPTLPLNPRFSLRADTSDAKYFQLTVSGGDYFSILQDTGPGPVNFIAPPDPKSFFARRRVLSRSTRFIGERVCSTVCTPFVAP
jgi:hypothetical protein